MHHTSGCVRHVLRVGINALRHHAKKCTTAHPERTCTPPWDRWKGRAIQTRGMSRGTRRSSPADWYLHMELLQSDPRFTAAPWVEGYQMLVLMIMCSAETLSYRRPSCNKHLLLACIRAQTDIKTLIAKTLINRNKPRENAVDLQLCRSVLAQLGFFYSNLACQMGPFQKSFRCFLMDLFSGEGGEKLGSRSGEVCYDWCLQQWASC